MIYLLVFCLLVLIFILYGHFARRFNITDRPNERSSHYYLTIRGGGVIFPVATIIWFAGIDPEPVFALAGLVIISVISFLDDKSGVSGKMRILVHFAAASLLFAQVALLDENWYILIAAMIIMVGWINAFNFMDGINGMTSFYSFVSLVSFRVLASDIDFVSPELILFLIISVMIFSYFNVRKKAKAFAGDVGSVSMAFLLGWMMLDLIVETGRFEYILLFSVYGIDSVLTIIHRIIRNENIFRAHRTHLYQYFTNELNQSHILVSAVFSAVQALVNIITIILIRNGYMDFRLFVIVLFIMTLVYLYLRYFLLKGTKDRAGLT